MKRVEKISVIQLQCPCVVADDLLDSPLYCGDIIMILQEFLYQSLIACGIIPNNTLFFEIFFLVEFKLLLPCLKILQNKNALIDRAVIGGNCEDIDQFVDNIDIRCIGNSIYLLQLFVVSPYFQPTGQQSVVIIRKNIFDGKILLQIFDCPDRFLVTNQIELDRLCHVMLSFMCKILL